MMRYSAAVIVRFVTVVIAIFVLATVIPSFVNHGTSVDSVDAIVEIGMKRLKLAIRQRLLCEFDQNCYPQPLLHTRTIHHNDDALTIEHIIALGMSRVKQMMLSKLESELSELYTAMLCENAPASDKNA